MSNQPPLTQIIESLLLFKGGSLRIAEIAKATESTTESVTQALLELEEILDGRGVQVVRDGDRVALSTASAAFPFVEKIRREELEGPVGRAGLETLAVIVYRGPVSRADIEYVRGVNVSTTLRSLLIRGLIERVDNPKDKRSFLYRTTPELPAYLGVSRIEELPGFAEVRAELDVILNTREPEPTAV